MKKLINLAAICVAFLGLSQAGIAELIGTPRALSLTECQSVASVTPSAPGVVTGPILDSVVCEVEGPIAGLPEGIKNSFIRCFSNFSYYADMGRGLTRQKSFDVLYDEDTLVDKISDSASNGIDFDKGMATIRGVGVCTN